MKNQEGLKNNIKIMNFKSSLINKCQIVGVDDIEGKHKQTLVCNSLEGQIFKIKNEEFLKIVSQNDQSWNII